jgi:hypothetical protein
VLSYAVPDTFLAPIREASYLKSRLEIKVPHEIKVPTPAGSRIKWSVTTIIDTLLLLSMDHIKPSRADTVPSCHKRLYQGLFQSATGAPQHRFTTKVDVEPQVELAKPKVEPADDQESH